jgi:hypothetical protein
MRTITTSAVSSGISGAAVISFSSSVGVTLAAASGVGIGAALIGLAY